MNAAIGVCTYNRPAMLFKTLRSIRQHVSEPLGLPVFVVNDGSDQIHHGEYVRAYKRLQSVVIQELPTNQGVAVAKNTLLRAMLETTDAEWLFLCEDDILVKSPEAITGYIRAAESASFHHLSFAHHGPANAGIVPETDGVLEYYPHSIGAWTCFSRECLESVGLFDERFVCAWEHVEHTLRLARAGFTSGAYRFADAVGSRDWLTEIPGSIEKSSIRPRPDWQANIRDGLRYWRNNNADTFSDLFGEDKPLYAYGQSVLR